MASTRRALAAAEDVGRAFDTSDRDLLARRLHPEGQLVSVLDDAVAVDTSTFLERLPDASDMFVASIQRLEEVAADVVIAHGTVRLPLNQSNGHTIISVSWLLGIRDGLLYRSQSYPSPQAAEADLMRFQAEILAPTPHA